MVETSPPRRRLGPPPFVDLLAAEFTRTAAGEQACGDTCPCHGGLTCARPPHPHTPAHWRHPDGRVIPATQAAGMEHELREAGCEYVDDEITVHAAPGPDGAPVQWVCTEPAQRVAQPSALRTLLDYDPDD